MESNVPKKNWNTPKLVKLNLTETSGGHQPHKRELKCHEHDSSPHGFRPCTSS